MKKILSLFFAAFLLITAAAQNNPNVNQQIAANPQLMYGTDCPYQLQKSALTPAPAGYTPFYISHYGRHGSRYHWGDFLYKELDTLLTTAHKQHLLTQAGEQFYEKYKATLPELMTGWGELTELGWQQHKGIAKQMYESFPEVFKDGGHVNAIASLVGRCVMSMASFCLELKECNPKLDIHEQSSRFTANSVIPGDRQNNPQWKGFTRIAPRFESSTYLPKEDTLLMREILQRTFTSTEGLGKSPSRIMNDLKDFYTSLPNINKVGMMEGLYTDEDVKKQWELSNLQTYSWMYGDQQLSLPILQDILKQAKDVIDGKSNDVASLRFGHDSYTGPLTVLLGINGADRNPENPSEVENCYQGYETCMAANIQLIFYRNTSAGSGQDSKNDILVKCLLNGAEVSLPLPTDNFPYYKWTDFINYYSKIQQLPPLMAAINKPVGEGFGVHPGRVAWVHCPGVATWDGNTGLWVEDRWNSQGKADQMVRETIKTVAGQKNTSKAWSAIFSDFNKRHNRGTHGYKPGEKIAIKLNINNALTHHDTIDLNSSPFVTLALLKSLINDAKVRQEDITVCEPSRMIPDSIYNKCHRMFPKVHFVDNQGGDGREKCEYYADQIHYSGDNGNMARGLAKCIVDATYLINSALLKTHVGPGVTLCGKNWYGATDININWRMNSHAHVNQDKRNGKKQYKTFVDWMGHKDMGQKCLLFLIDGTYASRDVNGKPSPKWQKAPFNNQWCCSIIASQDGVACDAVAMDLIINEWPDFRSLPYCDEYLNEAANIPHSPSGTTYDPEGDGKPLTKPLGLFEHCDQNRHYTKIDLQRVELR